MGIFHNKEPPTTEPETPTTPDGNPPDPTKNVLDLVHAETRRQDDLRVMADRHLRDLLSVTADYENQLRKSETARLDAIRAVDAKAIERAYQEAEQRAQALQNQVQSTAEAMRIQMSTSGHASAEALAALAKGMTEALTSAIRPLTEQMAAVQQTLQMQAGQRAQVVESREGRGETRLNLGAILGGVSVLLVVVGMFLAR